MASGAVAVSSPEYGDVDGGVGAGGGGVGLGDVPGLRENLDLLSDEDRSTAAVLLGAGQAAVFQDWAPPGSHDAEKRELLEQARTLDGNYPGGLRRYAENARTLLQSAARGENPLDGWTPSVPTTGFRLEVGSAEYLEAEELGLKEVGGCCFVVPAGGLGERLGYGGVKLALPVDLTSGATVLGLYAAYIRAFQACSGHRALPFVIMASGDTFEGITALLEENGHFGLEPSQVRVLLQEKVAALRDAEANFAMEGPYRISTKPHGHGDIHYLLHSHGLVEQWLAEGRRWVLFFQDSSTLYLATFLCSLGMSAKHALQVNSVTMPRRGKEAVGAIARLEHSDGRAVVVNVEYNQLEPLLKATGHPEGDVDGPDGFSPFPGNMNELIFSLPEYASQLRLTNGEVPEFINPKYADSTRSAFKSPTRLECMMQDYPKGLPPDARVGFTGYPAEFGYFPCKNDIRTAAALSAAGSPPHGAASAEAAVYRAHCRMLTVLGCHIGDPVERRWLGGPQLTHPAIVLWPDFAPCLAELRRKLPSPAEVRIAAGSSLEIRGRDIVLESLDLDGALRIEVPEGASLRIAGLSIRNKGHEFVALSEEEQDGGAPEELRIRGYRLRRHEECSVVVTPGPGAWVLGGADGALRRDEAAA